MSVPTRRILRPIFGQPTLEAGGDGKATWSRSLTPGTNRVAWAAKLDAGKQTSWNDYAKVIIPVNEIDFTDLDSVRLMSYYSVATGADMAVCVYMHDPNDFDQYIELSHTPLTNTATGYRELNFPTEPGGSSWGWYGNVTDTPDTCPSDWDTASYTWAQFQADSVFSTWTIYRITLDYGYQTGDIVLNDGYLCQALINNVSILLEPSLEEQLASLTDGDAVTNLPTWKFGQPTLIAHNNGSADWERGDSVLSTHQKGSTGWVARLHGGVQTGWDDAAAVYIPVNELPLVDLTSMLWTWYQTNAELVGIAPTLWVHDPTDNDKRAEISLDNVWADLEKAAGWNAHELSTSTDYLYYFGENTGATLSAGAENKYGLDDFQADTAFSTWTIYRISLEFGYHQESQVLEYAYLADVKVNGQVIPLKPSIEEQLDIVRDDQAKAIRAIPTWTFGKPALEARVNGSVEWVNTKDEPSRTRYGPYAAKLTGGTQASWASKAGIYFPVNNMPLVDLQKFLCVWYSEATEVINPFIGMHVFDPENPISRADISFSNGAGGGSTAPAYTSGWHEYEFGPADAQVQYFWYGDSITGSDITEGAVATLEAFQQDPVFSRFVISQMEFLTGSYTTGYLNPVFCVKLAVNGIDIPIEPSITEQLDMVRDDVARALKTIPTWTFGAPTLRSSNEGQASWSRWQYQKGATAWNALLEGGVQSGDDWASMFVPVNEMPRSELKTILWSYHKTDTAQSGVALEIWAHDPSDFSKRAEIGQTMAEVGTTAGWHSEKLDTSLSEFKWWGENVGSPDTCTTTNTNYTWAQYQTDSVFSTWTIYRIEFVIGWIGSGTLEPAHLAEVVINGTVIPLGPKSGKSSVMEISTKTIIGGVATANDIISEHASTGTDWDFNVGASGYITKAIVTIATHALTERLRLELYTVAPTCETDDNKVPTGPLAADIPNLVGWIDFPAMTDTSAAGLSYTIATTSTVGNLPLPYKGPALYGILMGLDGGTLGNVVCNISLFCDIQEDN